MRGTRRQGALKRGAAYAALLFVACLSVINPLAAAASGTVAATAASATLDSPFPTSIPDEDGTWWLNVMGNGILTDLVSDGPTFWTDLKKGGKVITRQDATGDPKEILGIDGTSYCDVTDTSCYTNWQYHFQKREADIGDRWERGILYNVSGLMNDLYNVKDVTEQNGTYFDVVRDEAAATTNKSAIKSISLNQAGKKLIDQIILGTSPLTSKCDTGGGSDCFGLRIEEQALILKKIQAAFAAYNPKDPRATTLDDKIRVSSNISQILLGSTASDGSPVSPQYSGNFYATIDDFGQAYALVKKAIQDIASRMAPGGSGLAPNDIQTMLNADVQSAVVDSETNPGVTTNATDDRCGNSGGLTDPVTAVYYGFCGVVVAFADFGKSVLVSSLKFLSITSGRPDDVSSIGPGAFDFITNSLPGVTSKGSYCGITTSKCTIQNDVVNPESSAGRFIRNAYDRLLAILNIFIIIAFLGIALANIFQVQLNVYSINKLLPGLIIAFILAHMSFFLLRGALEVSGEATGIFFANVDTSAGSGGTACGITYDPSPFGYYAKTFGQIAGANVESTTTCEAKLTTGNHVDITLLLQQFLLTILVLFAAVMLFILAFLFMVRVFVFYVLFVTAPLGILCIFFPPFKKWGDMWTKNLQNWLFMPTVAMFWIWLSYVFLSSTADAGVFGSLLGYIFTVFCLFMAIRTPFTMAGDAKVLVNGWNKFGKTLASPARTGLTRAAGTVGMFAADRTGLASAYRGASQYGKAQDERWKQRVDRFKNGSVDQGWITAGKRRRVANKVNELNELTGTEEENIKRIRSELNDLDPKDPASAIKKAGLEKELKKSEARQEALEVRLKRQQAKLEGPRSLFERLDYVNANLRKKAELDKEFDAENQKRLRSGAMLSNERLQTSQAKLDLQKEANGLVDEAMKDEIKTLRNGKERNGKAIVSQTDYRNAKQLKAEGEAESIRVEANRSSGKRFQRLNALIEREKEIKSMSDANWMEGVREIKNTDVRMRDEWLKNKKEGVIAKAQAEVAEADRDKAYNELLDVGALQKKLAATTDPAEQARITVKIEEAVRLRNLELQTNIRKEINTKAYEKTLNQHSAMQQRVIEYSTALSGLLQQSTHDDADIEQMRHFAKQLHDITGDQRYADIQAQVLAAAPNLKLVDSSNAADPRAAGKKQLLNSLNVASGVAKRSYYHISNEDVAKGYEKRIGKKASAYIGEEAGNDLTTGRHVGDIFGDAEGVTLTNGSKISSAEALGAILTGNTAELPVEAEIGFNGYLKGFTEGKLSREEASQYVDNLREVYTHNAAFRDKANAMMAAAVARGAKRRDGTTPFTANFEEFLTEMRETTDGNETGNDSRRNRWSHIAKEFDLEAINHDKRAANQPSSIHGKPRK